MATKDKSNIPLYLFAKVPVPGTVKTRMQPRLSERQSVNLATMMLEHTMIKVCEHWRGMKVLTVTPHGEDPLLLALSGHYGFKIEIQAAGNLGERMWQVLVQGIDSHGGAVVLGSDIPHIPETVIGNAWDHISAGKNFIGPALDGGFYLLGLSRPVEGIFDNVGWGGNSVLNSVQKNARRKGLSLDFYPMLRDIDTWEDLKWLAGFDRRYSPCCIDAYHLSIVVPWQERNKTKSSQM